MLSRVRAAGVAHTACASARHVSTTGGSLLLTALLRRAEVVTFTRAEEARWTAEGLLEMSACYVVYKDAEAELGKSLHRLSRRHAACLISVAATMHADARVQLDGRKLALLCAYLPTSPSALRRVPEAALTACWTHVAMLLTAGASAGSWRAHDLHAITSGFLRSGSRHASAPATQQAQTTVFHYLCAHAPRAADADTVAVLTTMTVNVQLSGGGLSGSGVSFDRPHQALAARAVALHAAEPIRAGLLAHLCAQWNRVRFAHAAFAALVESQAVDVAESADDFSVVQCFLFLWRQPQVGTEAAIPSLLERLCSGLLDARTWSEVSRAVADPAHLSSRVAALRAELRDVVTFLCTQLVELFSVKASEGGLEDCTLDELQTYTTQLIALRRVLCLTHIHTDSSSSPLGKSNASCGNTPESLPMEFATALAACAERVGPASESLMAAESPPFALMSALADTPCDAAQTCCLTLLHEAALQYVHLPTAQAFQFLLVVGDAAHGGHGDCENRPAVTTVDAAVMEYLADAFVKTASAIPPIQLVTALRVFAFSVVAGCAQSRNREALVRFCAEKIRGSLGDGTMPVHALLVGVAALHRMGCRDDDLYAACAAYLQAKAGLVQPKLLCATAATAVCEAFGEDILDEYSTVHELLLEAVSKGIDDDMTLAPSAWMHRHDPASTLLPLTPSQMHCRQLLSTMSATPAHEHGALVSLAQEYIASLTDAHPDDHRRFFAVFEDKVLKEDALLLTCVKAITDDPLLLSRLSGASLAAILHSLAAVRFTYTAAVKMMLLRVTREQWEAMSAAALVDVLTGMSQLSLAVPAAQSVAMERLIALTPVLTPVQTALAVRALQSLAGCSADARRATQDTLLRHAAKNAQRFDEVALSVLFSSPSVHRLLREASVALPLIQQAASQITSTPQRHRIAACLRRSGLSRDAIAGATDRLLTPHAPQSLRLAR